MVLERLLEQKILQRSNNGGLELSRSSLPLQAAVAGFVDSLESRGGKWLARGWAVDPETKQPCVFVIPLQSGKVASNVVFRKSLRPDVSAHLRIKSGEPVGFTASFEPGPERGPVTLVAVLPSGRLALLPAPALQALEDTEIRLAPAAPDSGWEWFTARPLYSFSPDSPFRGIYSFHPTYNARNAGGVTEQFLEDASVYHRKYTEYPRWTFLLTQAFERVGITAGPEQEIRILDEGSGSGNSVIPLLQLFPAGKLVATDISPQLLAILRDQIQEPDRHRVRIIAMDAVEQDFNPAAFDLVVGAAILHHLVDPSEALGACHHCLRTGGKAIFYEPFEQGFLLLRLLYEEMLERRKELALSEKVEHMLTAIVTDIDVRTGSDKSDDLFQHIDDKWLFTRTYFENQKERLGFSHLALYPLDVSLSRFSSFLTAHLRVCLQSGEEALSNAAWDYVHAFDRKISAELHSEILMEACVVLTK